MINMIFFKFSKKEEGWNASGFSAPAEFADICFQSSWATKVHLWGPCLSLEDSIAGTILQLSVNSSNAGIQFSHE